VGWCLFPVFWKDEESSSRVVGKSTSNEVLASENDEGDDSQKSDDACNDASDDATLVRSFGCNGTRRCRRAGVYKVIPIPSIQTVVSGLDREVMTAVFDLTSPDPPSTASPSVCGIPVRTDDEELFSVQIRIHRALVDRLVISGQESGAVKYECSGICVPEDCPRQTGTVVREIGAHEGCVQVIFVAIRDSGLLLIALTVMCVYDPGVIHPHCYILRWVGLSGLYDEEVGAESRQE